MQPILVAYGSTDGQTRKIAEFIAQRLRIRGHRVDLIDTSTPAAQQVPPLYQGAIVGGSVHQHRHPRALVHFLKNNRAWLASMPVALFSVSLAAALDDMDSRLEAQRLLDELTDDCGLLPIARRCIAGALKYTQYDYLTRQVMRLIARQRGQATDTSADAEYTDWNDIEAFVDEYLATAGIAGPAKAA
jgi:menaquinone-dependent protoporphyrinogen oxidase